MRKSHLLYIVLTTTFLFTQFNNALAEDIC